MTIYLDNAATSWPKPEAVYRAVDHFMRDVGATPGRGGYRREEEALRIADETREALARLFHARGRAADALWRVMICSQLCARRSPLGIAEIMRDEAAADAIPMVRVTDHRAKVTHETIIGAVDKKELEMLMTRGLNEEATAMDIIVQGMLDT